MTLQERHQLLTTILDAVYIDMKGSKSIVSVKLKPVFQAVLALGGSAIGQSKDGNEFVEMVLSEIRVGAE